MSIAGEEESVASQGARPADEAATHKTQLKEDDAKEKAAAAPDSQDIAPDNVAPAAQAEPEISWRGTRTGEETACLACLPGAMTHASLSGLFPVAIQYSMTGAMILQVMCHPNKGHPAFSGHRHVRLWSVSLYSNNYSSQQAFAPCRP